MLQEKSLKILGNLLMSISKAESSIQITRQILSKSINYSPNYLFSLISNSAQITDIDLYNYLISINIPITQICAKLIILFYDKNMDSVLSFDEFIKIVNNTNLVNNNFLQGKIDGINDNIVFLFDKILQKEIELCTNFIVELKKLKSRNDFDTHKVFHHITNLTFINKIDLEKFMKEINIEFLDKDINNIMKRLDINNDGIIDIEEFHILFDFPKSIKNNYRFILCNKCRELQNKFNKYTTKQNTNLINNNRYSQNNKGEQISSDFPNQIFHSINNSNKKNLKMYSSLNIARKKFHSQEKNPNLDIDLINNKQDLNKNLYNSIDKLNNSDIINNIKNMIYFLRNKKKFEGNQKYDICLQNNINPKVKSSRVSEISYYINSNQNFLKKFNNLLELIMQNEIEIEKEKINFFKNVEVNFAEIYSIFDENKKGYITEEEIKNGFYKIKMIDEENYEIFMNRFDINRRKRIEELEFFDIVVPFNKKYRKFIENRIIISHFKENYNIFEDANIISCLKNLLCFIINKEKEINNYKINFIEKNYNLELIHNIFNEIDKAQKGFFTYEDLKMYLKNYNLISDNYAVALLFIRLDKKRKGIIELENLISEL